MIALLPFKSSRILGSRKDKQAVLFLLLQITQESIEALSFFLERAYKKFDAQVGDTSCQVRAYKICLLSNDKNFIGTVFTTRANLIAYKEIVKNKLEKFTAQIQCKNSYSKELDCRCDLLIFIEQQNLENIISNDIKFIITAFFLNKYCLKDKDGIPKSINYQLIKTTLSIGSTPARQIANHYQAILSQLSCEFVLSLLSYYPMHDGNQTLLAQFLRKGDRGRMMLPYYNETKILLFSNLTVHLPIALSLDFVVDNHCKKIVLLFKRNPLTHTLELIKLKHMNNSKECCLIFKGKIILKETESIYHHIDQILCYHPANIILSNAASHPQYSGVKQADFKINPYLGTTIATNKLLTEMALELKKFQEFSKQLGCHLENKSLFFITHIFCDLIQNEVRDSLFYSSPAFHNAHFDPILPSETISIAA